MNVVLLRVGIDSGSGGAQGPLFSDGTFEFIPIPDIYGEDERTYGNTTGRQGVPLVQLLPPPLRARMQQQAMHCDPEFDTHTYGDPAGLKAGMRRLGRGDLLVFYAGLEGWDFPSGPALYLIGYFEVETAGFAGKYTDSELRMLFQANAHVRNPQRLIEQRERLVLVKGGPGSRLLTRAARISELSVDRSGKPLKVLSPEAQRIFGTFGGRVSIQRSPPRWVEPAYCEQAAEYVRGLV